MQTASVQGLVGRLRPLVAGLALIALAATAPAASADVTTLVPTGSGLTLPMGAARDNGGAIWVADTLMGVCKVDTALPGGNALVQDGKWCAPAPAGGAPPAGPAAAFQMAFDSASSTLFVAEGASSASGIWKFAIDPATSTITDGKKIVFEADRVFGLALGTDASGQQILAYSTKRSPLVHVLDNPLTCNPCSPIIGGSAQAKGAAALAFVGSTLYLAETAIGVTRLDNPGPTGGIAQIVAGFPSPLVTALTADPARGRVYAGTTIGNNQDEIDAMQTSNGAVETYATGMVGVTALSVDPNGALLVGDSPLLPVDTAGHGRLQSVSLGVLGAPRVTFTAGPPTFTNHSTATFAFTGPAGSTFECRLDAAGPADPWTACGSAPSGSFTTGTLSEGTHVFEARAVSPDPAIGAGPAQRRTFVVDSTAPHLTIDNSPADAVLTGATTLTMRFSSNEAAVAFACSLDGAVPMPCSDPKPLTGLTVGDHVFTVTATDGAGNSSPTASFAFSVLPAPAAPAPAAPAPAVNGTRGGRP